MPLSSSEYCNEHEISVDVLSHLRQFRPSSTLFVYISRLLLNIGVGRFRILGGGQGLEFWEGQGGGGKFPVGTGRRNDVDAT